MDSSSARETTVRVAAGAIARKWLRENHGVVIRGHMTQLVDTQNAKWAYMFRKIDAALGR